MDDELQSSPGSSPIVLPSTTRPARVEIIPSFDPDALAVTPSTATSLRHRTGSDASLSSTIEFYNIPPTRVTTGSGAILHTQSASALAPGPVRTPAVSITHSASILPSSSFFHPKQPSRALSPQPPLASSSSAAGSDLQQQQRRLGNGPLITRISSEYARVGGEKLLTRRLSVELEDQNELKRLSPAVVGSRSTSRPTSPFADPAAPSVVAGLIAGSSESTDHLSGRHSSEELPLSGKLARASEHRYSLSGASGTHTTSSTRRPSSDLPSSNPPSGGGPRIKESREPLLEFPSSGTTDVVTGLRPDRATKSSHGRKVSDEMRRHQTSISIKNGVEDVVQRARNSFSMGKTTVELGSAVGRNPLPGSQPLVDASIPAEGEKGGNPSISIPGQPILDEKGRKLRNYQRHAGANRFFFSGRLLSSKDSPVPFLMSLLLAILLPVLFFAFSGDFLWHHLGGGGKASLFIFVWMSAVMITNMCTTAWRDPGIIPRGLDKVPERKWVPDLNGDGDGGWRAEPRYMRLREGVIASKWCNTCATYRPPRTSHCRLCDNCVDHTDHHCTFLNNCIGRRNYTSFIAFLVSAILCAIYAISFSCYHISTRHRDLSSGWASTWDVVGSFVVAILSFGLMLPMSGLLGYHLRLLWTNHTTIEMLRPKDGRSGAIDPSSGQSLGNLYALRSPLDNIISLLCRPMAVESWVKPWGTARQDERLAPSGKEEEG